jgi:hypothetical protein
VEIIRIVLLMLSGSLGYVKKGLAGTIRESAPVYEQLYCSPVAVSLVQAVLHDHLIKSRFVLI